MVTMSNCRSANGVSAPSCVASAGAGPSADGQRLPDLGQHAARHVAAGEVGARALLCEHPHEVAGAAAVVEHGKPAALQLGLAAQQPARLHGDELVGRIAHHALDGIVEAAIVGRGVAIELGRLHLGPPTMSRIMNNGRPLLWS